MATRGIFQCKTITLRYCEYGGSSRAVRDYLASGELIDWASTRPSVKIEVQVKNGKHPNIRADYATQSVSNKSCNGGNGIPSKPVIHQVCLKSSGIYTGNKDLNDDNKNPNYVQDAFDKLYNKSGRKMKKFTQPIYTDTPSIQGVWTPSLDLHLVPAEEINNKYFKLQFVGGNNQKEKEASKQMN